MFNRIISGKVNFSLLGSLIVILLILSACNVDAKKSVAPVENDFAKANWIGTQEELPVIDSLFYADNPSPVFRKEFTAKNEIRSAVLYITAAGYYRASINGERIGKNYLDPAWTNFSKRIYYTEYDLKDALKQGNNCLGITLGNGFYNPLPMKFWAKYNLRDAVPNGKPQRANRRDHHR